MLQEAAQPPSSKRARSEGLLDLAQLAAHAGATAPARPPAGGNEPGRQVEQLALRIVDVDMQLLPGVVSVLRAAGEVAGAPPVILLQLPGSASLLPPPPPPGAARRLLQLPDGRVVAEEGEAGLARELAAPLGNALLPALRGGSGGGGGTGTERWPLAAGLGWPQERVKEPASGSGKLSTATDATAACKAGGVEAGLLRRLLGAAGWGADGGASVQQDQESARKLEKQGLLEVLEVRG